MNKTNTLVSSGIALLVGSVLAVAPVAAASPQGPARVCVDNAFAGPCEADVRPASFPGGSEQEVVERPAPSGRPDAKDHPNYGPITPGRLDAKDHPNYGPNTPGRLDAKDHPNYGPNTPGRLDAKDHPNYGPNTPV